MPVKRGKPGKKFSTVSVKKRGNFSFATSLQQAEAVGPPRHRKRVTRTIAWQMTTFTWRLFGVSLGRFSPFILISFFNPFIYLFISGSCLGGSDLLFLGAKINSLFWWFFKKIPKEHGQGNLFFLKISKNICHISLKKVLKSPRFLEDLGRFF